MTTIFDPGLQPERTELAWRRTCLALGVGSLVALRVLPEVFGSAWWALGGVAGALASGTLWLAARRRYRQGTIALERDGDHARLPDGRLAIALTAFVVVIGIVSVALILASV
ncbi:MAG: DUF202 domain-containing protein [Microbacterium sp.]